MSVVPSQILYLEHGSARLYAEAIQVVEARRLCWARPTLLIQGLPVEADAASRQAAIALAATNPVTTALSLYDLKESPDLIWPIELFQIAYDLDFFSILVKLKISPNEMTTQSGLEQLSRFIRSFWHTHPAAFQPAGRELSSTNAR